MNVCDWVKAAAPTGNEFRPSDAAVRLWSGCTWVNGRVSVSSDEMINPAPHHHVPQESHSEWRPSEAEGDELGVAIPELQN